MTADVLKRIPLICMFLPPALAQAQEATFTATVVDTAGGALSG